jgi:hypothetical protein
MAAILQLISITPNIINSRTKSKPGNMGFKNLFCNLSSITFSQQTGGWFHDTSKLHDSLSDSLVVTIAAKVL